MPNKNLVAVALVAMVAIIGGLVALAMMKTDNAESVTQYLMVAVTVIAVPVITALISLLSEHNKTVKGATEIAREARNVAADTNHTVKELANGAMDAKIERVVRRVFEEYGVGTKPDKGDDDTLCT